MEQRNTRKKKPKQPSTAYNVFIREFHQKYLSSRQTGHVDAKLSLKLAASCWKKLSASEKLVYENIAAEDRVRYAQELIRWHEEVKATATVPSDSVNHNETVETVPDLASDRKFS